MTCTSGKVCFPSPQAAWSTAGHVRRRHKHTDNRTKANHVHAYRCRECGAWHISGTPAPKGSA